MKDIDIELLKLRQLRADLSKEMALEEARRSKDEYARLTSGVVLVASLTVLAQIFAKTPPFHSLSQTVISTAGLGLVLVASIVKFFITANQSALGVSGYLKIELTLLTNEMPNIFQIISLLGFLNVFLKESAVRIAVTLVLTFLLLLYLSNKRRDMVSRSAKLKKQVTSEVTVPLSIILGCLIGAMVYGIASLVAAQIGR